MFHGRLKNHPVPILEAQKIHPVPKLGAPKRQPVQQHIHSTPKYGSARIIYLKFE